MPSSQHVLMEATKKRAQERGYAYQARFPQMPSAWVDFVDQNKAAEAGIARLSVRRSYEHGRTEAIEAITENWTASPSPAPLRPENFDPVAIIDRLVQDAVAQRIAQYVPAAAAAPLVPAVNTNTDDPSATAEGSATNDVNRLSDVLAKFLKPLDRKRKHTAKGRGEAEPVIRFAVDFLGDPRMSDLTDAQWKRLDEALPDIPNRDNIPATLRKRSSALRVRAESRMVRSQTSDDHDHQGAILGRSLQVRRFRSRREPLSRPSPEIRMHRSRKSGSSAARCL
jgi:hypothetical protein